MARRHWLDPLARRLLMASGQLPTAPGKERQKTVPGCDPEPQVERDLLELKLRQNPSCPLRNADEVGLAAELGWRLDVNRAGAQDWRRLPGIGDDQVDLLMRLQAGGVQLSCSEDLQRLLDAPAALVQTWLPVLVFRWYGEPTPSTGAPVRVDLNRAGPAQLEQLGLTIERQQRLLRERARRPFRDLADLQERLHLPPELVEHWIGRVRFSQSSAGPVLPPARRAG